MVKICSASARKRFHAVQLHLALRLLARQRASEEKKEKKKHSIFS